jgi:hypothetical protein
MVMSIVVANFDNEEYAVLASSARKWTDIGLESIDTLLLFLAKRM